MCSALIFILSIPVIALVVSLFVCLARTSNVFAAWKSEWDGVFEKPVINYSENWNPKAWRTLGYFMFRRYLEIPDEDFVAAAEKLRSSYIFTSVLGLLLGGLMLASTWLEKWVCV